MRRNIKWYHQATMFNNHEHKILMASWPISLKYFLFWHHPGAYNTRDYPSKSHTGPIHDHARSWILQIKMAPSDLSRKSFPSSRRGCAKILANPYHKRTPLPRIPVYRELNPTDGHFSLRQHLFPPFPVPRCGPDNI